MTGDSKSTRSVETIPAGVYRFDSVHTFASFSVKHDIVGRVNGRFDTIAGSFVVTDDADPRFDLIEADIDAASVSTKVDARDEDLRSPRFFDAATYAALTFRGRGSRAGRDGVWIVDGDLSIRGVTLPVSFDVTVSGTTVDPGGRTRLGAIATAVLTRRDFGLTTELEQESGNSGDADIEVRLDIEALLEPDQQP